MDNVSRVKAWNSVGSSLPEIMTQWDIAVLTKLALCQGLASFMVCAASSMSF
jgi:hypothetical protein